MMTYDGSSTAAGVTLYVDGLIVRTVAESNGLSETIKNNVPLHIGMRKSAFSFWGRIDDVRIYNRRLSDKEVQQLFESGVRTLAGVPAETRTPEQQALLAAAYRPQDEPVNRLGSQLAATELELRDARWNAVRRWYVTGQGQTMMVIPNPAADKKSQIATDVAISSDEVTVAEFRRFRETHGFERAIAPTDDCPVHGVSWYDAAAYCNWLSQQEGIPEDQWVYQPNNGGQYADGMKIKEQWSELQGYRLPSDAEWESACRSGTSGSYGFGEPLLLLKQYSGYTTNSSGRSYSVGSLLPNEAGLFNLHGNIWEWVQNPTSGQLSPVNDNAGRGLRGGSFDTRSSNVRSAYGSYTQPTYRDANLGFRLARTLPPSPLTSLPTTP